MPVYDEEVFGPVVAIIAVKDEEEAIRVANDTRMALELRSGPTIPRTQSG